MKKALSLILALVLCLSLCACGGSNDVPETEVPNTTEMTNAQTEQTQPKEMTVMDAERIGKEYLDSAFGRMRFLSSVKNSVKNADSFSSFSINKSTTEQDGRYYYCTFHLLDSSLYLYGGLVHYQKRFHHLPHRLLPLRFFDGCSLPDGNVSAFKNSRQVKPQHPLDHSDHLPRLWRGSCGIYVLGLCKIYPLSN